MRNFWWRCTRVLPTVYDDSLSYYEVLCKLTKRVEELEKKVAPYVHNVTVKTSVWELTFQVTSGQESELSSDDVVKLLGEQGFTINKLLGCNGCGDDGKIGFGLYVDETGLNVKYVDSNGIDTVGVGTFTTYDVVV